MGTFALIAALGILLSLSAPHIKSDDELVYLTGALEARDGDLPDAYMLQGYEFGPYLHPKVLLAWYEPLGHDAFKSLYLFVLILATGLAAYALFRLIFLPWVPALLLAVVLLLPRAAAGIEFFGVFTFREAIGRSAAFPLFLLGSGLLVRRMLERQPLWPVFALFGIFLFLHPVTVTLFAFVALGAVVVTRLIERTRVVTVIREAFVSGVAFMAAGSYFFVEVFSRLSNTVADTAAPTAAYVSAVVFRNAWEFPEASLQWYRHMGVVSACFVLAIAFFYLLPRVRAFRKRYPFPHARIVMTWGISMMVLALVLALLAPGLNLYLMEHANASYIFQQWSRISKFYYLGLFIAMVPMVGSLWMGFQASAYRYKKGIVVLLVVAGIGSSSLVFEIAQFAIGYPDYTEAYIPQALSGVPDDISSSEYRETCAALARMGATSADTIVSNDFGLRYYCKSNLNSSFEEGAAYTFLSRSDLVEWHAAYLAQREALSTADVSKVFGFATGVSGHFLVLPRIERFVAFTELPGAVVTTRHIVVPVPE